MTTLPGRPVHRALAAVALVLGALAAASGDASTRAEPPPAEVTALELARWIRAARPNLRVIDLRDLELYESFSIPGAERMGVDDLGRMRWAPDADVVLFADSVAIARMAHDTLRARGVRNVHVLEGGLGGWINTIASPVLPANPSPAERTAVREIAEMSRWFGGSPRVGESRATTGDSVRAAMGRIRRRGC